MTWEEFLVKLVKAPTKEIQTKIIWMNNASLSGVIISGSISMDGKSSIRRSCSLNLVTETTELKNYDWTLGTEFEVEIGVTNTTGINLSTISFEDNPPVGVRLDNNKPIIWFKQGHFLITSYNHSISLTSTNISISGKDKMAKLNGDIGGHVRVTTDLSVEIDDKGNEKKLTIDEIIKAVVTIFGNEIEDNINIDKLPKGKIL